MIKPVTWQAVPMLCQHWDSALGLFQLTSEHAARGNSYRGLRNPPYIFLRLSWSSILADPFLKAQMPASVPYHIGISGPPHYVGPSRRGTTKPHSLPQNPLTCRTGWEIDLILVQSRALKAADRSCQWKRSVSSTRQTKSTELLLQLIANMTCCCFRCKALAVL